MDPKELEEIIWELSRHDEPAATGQAVPGELDDYRAGRLEGEAARRVATRLGRDPEVRRQLIERSGLAAAAPPPALRERVLEAFEASGRPAPKRRWATWLGSAALAASLLMAVLFGLRASRQLPAELAYRVEVSALQGLRQDDPPAGPTEVVRAYPETLVEISAIPEDLAEADLEAALYRQRPAGLERLRDLEPETDRGAIRWRVRADRLAGPDPGVHNLFLVIARRGDLPSGGVLEPGEAPERALGAGRRRLVYRRPILLLPDSESVP